ncbi:MAG: hypothetical protein A3K19_18125 [Lentisphaerae bacterium RIFOXYB12_FULL_65_16]|nr:MAG: hypothetical protein A3K18_12560 [Lentisphaerae bacterium RIFOXYA12_64_32]OGV87095.1 MAG: hypothetical protein A3K19_18125 [Lentisphaerae bacterium RIFOXYB12_FULL_65_16]
MEETAIAHCRTEGFEIVDNRGADTLQGREGTVDCVITSHVIEHFPKGEIIAVLQSLRRLLSPNGYVLIAVPNAQSFTGCYWAYEDFTHETMFTSGSLYYVLRAAGFATVRFVDVDCLEGLPVRKKLVRRALLTLYRAHYWFWRKATGSPTHAPSPDIFSWEIKAMATTRDGTP